MVPVSAKMNVPEQVLVAPDGHYTDGCKEPPMSQKSTHARAAEQPGQTICTRVEFDCEVCGRHVSKWWHPRMPGKPRFCTRACKSEFQRRAKPVTRGWLEQKYIAEGLDCTQIGRLVSRDAKSVWNWLKDFGIPTRPRGCNAPLLPHGRAPGFRHTPQTREKLRQIALAQGRVPYDPAVGSYMKGRRGPDTPRWKGGITPERQAFYATQEWKVAARAAKKRDKNTCQRCGRVKTRGDGVSFDLHHLVPFECVALRAVVDNLVYLCEPCHYWVHGAENVEGRFVLPCPSGTNS